MRTTPQMFELRINFGLDTEAFDVAVINRSPRKGFIDIEEMVAKLTETFNFMLKDGMDELVEQIKQEQLQ